MAARALYRINLTFSERSELERLAGAPTTPQHIARRARIILLANEEGMPNQQIAEQFGTTKGKVTKWLKRWIDGALVPIRERLSDRPRSGRPDNISAEQWCQIVALACESPEDYGRPITHWTSRELADEAVKQGIVESLSAGHLRKVLKKKRCSLTAAAIG